MPPTPRQTMPARDPTNGSRRMKPREPDAAHARDRRRDHRFVNCSTPNDAVTPLALGARRAAPCERRASFSGESCRHSSEWGRRRPTWVPANSPEAHAVRCLCRGRTTCRFIGSRRGACQQFTHVGRAGARCEDSPQMQAATAGSRGGPPACTPGSFTPARASFDRYSSLPCPSAVSRDSHRMRLARRALWAALRARDARDVTAVHPRGSCT